MDKGEVSTKALIDQAFKDGKTVFLPRIVAYDNSQPKTFQNQKSELKMIAMNSSQQVASLKPRGKYQLREPDDGPDCKFYI